MNEEYFSVYAVSVSEPDKKLLIASLPLAHAVRFVSELFSVACTSFEVRDSQNRIQYSLIRFDGNK